MKKIAKGWGQKVVSTALVMGMLFFNTTTAWATSSTISSSSENSEKTASASTSSKMTSAESGDGENTDSTTSTETENIQGKDAKGNGFFVDFDMIIGELGEDADKATVQAYLSEMLKDASEANFNTIYLDTWRGGRAAWYSDAIPSKDPYDASIFDYVIQVAAKRDMDVVLWVDPMWDGADAIKGKAYLPNTEETGETKLYDIGTEEGYLAAINELHALLDATSNYSNITGVLLETEVSNGEVLPEPYTEKTDSPRYRYTKQIGEILKERNLEFGVLNTGFYNNQMGVEKTVNKATTENQTALKKSVLDWLEGVGAGYFMPGLNVTTGVADGKTYNDAGELVELYNLEERLTFCETLFADSDILWKPVIMQPNTTDPHEMVAEIILMQNTSSDGFGYMDYVRLKNGDDKLLARVGELLSDRDLRDLSIDPTFRITRPSKDTTIYTATYYIMGIADPDKTITTLDGEAIEDRGSNGVFGLFVDLELGENTFTFVQGTEEKTVIITRENPATGEATPAKIGVITQSSMTPTYDTPIFTKDSSIVSLSCNAPSGGVVTAEVEGKKVTLKQEKTADSGVAAKYGGSTKLTGTYDASKVEELGTIKYTLEWQGKTTSYTSTGNYFVVGSEADFYVKAADILTQTYAEPKTASGAAGDYNYYGVMNYGSLARVKLNDEVDTLSTYALYGGGYVLKNKVNIIPTQNLPSSRNAEGAFTISGVQYKAEGNSETFRFVGAGNAPFAFTGVSPSGIEASLFNVSMDASAKEKLQQMATLFGTLSAHGESLSIEIYTAESTSAVKLKLTCDGNLQGYDVQYDGDDTLISFHFKKEQVANTEKPLQGMTILLDPGHGGSDGGAPSPAQEWGPTEKDMTIQLAHRVQTQLEALGATVYSTREYDVRVELYDRAALFEKIQPDYFISIHLNSLKESANAGVVDGAKIYYFNENSGTLAQEIVDDVAFKTGRDNNGIEEGAYVVVRPTAAPSVLCELGFLPNPVEYSNMLDETDLEKTATGIVNGLLASIQLERPAGSPVSSVDSTSSKK